MIEIKDQDLSAIAPIEVQEDGRRNVKPKKQIKVAKNGKAGDIDHWHAKENEFETWDEPCYFVEFRVVVSGGIVINGHTYAGKVIVPQCTADYLAWQQSEKLRYEQNIYRSKTVNKTVAAL
jgi:hypothetical protein